MLRHGRQRTPGVQRHTVRHQPGEDLGAGGGEHRLAKGRCSVLWGTGGMARQQSWRLVRFGMESMSGAAGENPPLPSPRLIPAFPSTFPARRPSLEYFRRPSQPRNAFPSPVPTHLLAHQL